MDIQYSKPKTILTFKELLSLIVTIVSLGLIIHAAFAGNVKENKTPLQVCQERYMEATNILYRYNETHTGQLSVTLPPYTCGTSTPDNKGVPPKTSRWQGLDENKIVISDWLNAQEIELISHYQNIICNRAKTSPLCTQEGLLERLYIITEARLPGKNWFPILLGITNAESTFGTNFANDNIGGKCDGRNNLGGVKWKITDTGDKSYSNNGKFGYNYSHSHPTDDYGCYLYPFDSIEDYWRSKVNTFRYGYKGCIDSYRPIWCVSGDYVGNKYIHEQSWINNVSIFLN